MNQKLLNPPKFYLNVEICKSIYETFKQILKFKEPLPHFESRYPNLLESALSSISGSYDGQQFYPTVLDTAAGYYSKIACGHAFANGNKRLGILFTDYFLFSNDLELTIPQIKLYVFTEELVKLAEKGTKTTEMEQIIRKILETYCEDLK